MMSFLLCANNSTVSLTFGIYINFDGKVQVLAINMFQTQLNLEIVYVIEVLLWILEKNLRK